MDITSIIEMAKTMASSNNNDRDVPPKNGGHGLVTSQPNKRGRGIVEEDEIVSNGDDDIAQTRQGQRRRMSPPRRIVIPMVRGEDFVGNSEESSEGEEGGGESSFRPIGFLREEKNRRDRVSYLWNKVCGRNRAEWICKFCDVGDGKVDGLSSDNMKRIYSMENDLRSRLSEQHYIHTIVDAYNSTVVDENTARNPDSKLQELTYEEYELHMNECYARRNVVETMWRRFECYAREADYIREKGFKYRTSEGRFVLGHKDVNSAVALERECRQYLLALDRVETRHEKDREKARAKLNNEMSRHGKSFYDK